MLVSVQQLALQEEKRAHQLPGCKCSHPLQPLSYKVTFTEGRREEMSTICSGKPV